MRCSSLRTPATIALAAATIVSALLVTGCGTARKVGQAARMANDARDGKMTYTNEKGEKTTIETKPGGEGGTYTVTGKEGTTTAKIGADAVKQEDLGVDFYPGATVEHGATSTSAGTQGGKYSQAMLSTTDPFETVAKFYKDKYSQGNAVTEQPNMLMIMIGEGKTGGKMIMVTAKDGKTEIVISSGAGM